MQVFDNTNYPETFDPIKVFTKEDDVLEKEILGLNVSREEASGNDYMLTMTCYLFHHP